jgi:Phosphate-starvation-inducible E family
LSARVRCRRPLRPQPAASQSPDARLGWLWSEVLRSQSATLLISLEFNHTLQYVIAREKRIVQARVVILIVLLALARKAIVTDLTALSAGWLAGFAALAT